MPAISTIKELIAEALSNKSDNRKWHTLGPVRAGDAALIKLKTGIDVAGYTRIIDVSGILHTLNAHGDPEKEKKIGQRAITPSDIEKIPLIVRTKNVAWGGKNNRGLDVLVYEWHNFGTWYYLEEVRAQYKKLALNTMWKK